MNVFLEFLATLVLAVGSGAIAYALARSNFSSQPRGQRIFQWMRSLSSHWADRAFFSMALGYTLVLSSLSIIRFLAFRMGDHYINSGYDLGQYDQLIWNSLHGRLFENTLLFDAPLFLGKSFTPILLAFVPLYAVWTSPIVLLIVQTVALALSAFPIYWFARGKLAACSRSRLRAR